MHLELLQVEDRRALGDAARPRRPSTSSSTVKIVVLSSKLQPSSARALTTAWGRKPGRLEVLHRRRAVALAEALAVLAEDERDVGVVGRRRAERPDHHHLLGRVGDVVLAAQHVGDAHVHVVHGGGEVVGRRAVGAHDDEVLDRAVVEGHRAADVVLDDRLARRRSTAKRQAGRRPSASSAAISARVAVAAAAHHGGALVGAGGGPLRLELLVGLVGRVDRARRPSARAMAAS